MLFAGFWGAMLAIISGSKYFMLRIKYRHLPKPNIIKFIVVMLTTGIYSYLISVNVLIVMISSFPLFLLSWYYMMYRFFND
jgi:hypothetical protein